MEGAWEGQAYFSHAKACVENLRVAALTQTRGLQGSMRDGA